MKSFLNMYPEQAVLESERFFVIEDGFPVSPGHCLIISKALKTDYFELSPEERHELVNVVDRVREWIEGRHSPDGYNIGMNCREAAGQTVPHFHCHVIPRYAGDTPSPRGGVRGVIPERMAY